jgi:ABC-2 type transport system ATP-binding protein
MGSAGDIAVRVSGLRKSYGALEALAGVDIEIRRGEVFGLLGPNGASTPTAASGPFGRRSGSCSRRRAWMAC